MANEFDYFPLYYLRLLKDTAHMNNEQFGAYVRVLLNSWDVKPVGQPKDDDMQLAAMAHADPERWKVLKPIVMARFKGPVKGHYLQTRMCNTYRELRRVMRAKEERARLGGLAKAQKAQEKQIRLLKQKEAGRKAVLKPANKTKPNQTKEKEIKPNQTSSADVAAVLRWAGVGGGAKKCGEVPGLTPIAAMIEAERNKKSGGGPGMLVEHLVNGYRAPRIVLAATLTAMAKRGRIVSICGHLVRGGAGESNLSYTSGQGGDDLIIVASGGDVRIAAADLRAETIIVNLEKEL